MKTINQFILIILLGIVGYFAWEYQEHIPFLGDQQQQAKSKKRPSRAVLVIGANAKVQDLRQVVTAVGTLKANQSIDLSAKVTAKVSKIEFIDGQKVKKGDPLVYLDDSEARSELAESVAQLANSKRLYQRAVKLFKSGNTPKARVDLLLSEMQVAEAKVAADRARLADYVVRAPFQGVVGFRDISQGTLIRPGERITTLDDVTTLKLDFELPESVVSSVRPGQSFEAESVAFDGLQFGGQVTTIATRVDPVARVVRVRGLLDNAENRLKPGMFLSVKLQTGLMKDVVMIPEHSIVISPAGHFAFVVTDSVASRKSIEIGQRQKGWVQVVNGVGPSDVVVTEGLQKIRDGAKVKLKVEVPSGAEASNADGNG